MENKKIDKLVKSSRAIGWVFIIIGSFNLIIWSFILFTDGLNQINLGSAVIILTMFINMIMGIWLIILSGKVDNYKKQIDSAKKSNKNILIINIIILISAVLSIRGNVISLLGIILPTILIIQSVKASKELNNQSETL